MVILGVAATVAAGIAVGWMGHRASLRIKVWGEGMDACDEIFRRAAGIEDAKHAGVRTPPQVSALASSHLRPAGMK